MQKSKLQFKGQKLQYFKQVLKFSTSYKLQATSYSGGYIALISLLVVATAGLTISLAVSIAGIEEIQISHGLSQSAKARNLANACIEDGLERLRNNFVSYSGSLSIDGNSCIIDIVAGGGTATLDSLGTVDIYNQKIQVQVDNTLSVTSWIEE